MIVMDHEAEPETAHRPHRKPLALVNARLVDPASGLDAFGGLLIANGTIADLGMHITEGSIEGAESLDCGGRTVAPGLIDMMVFCGEPGHEHRETLATASRAAAAGGVTTICCMPNTDPVIDDVYVNPYDGFTNLSFGMDGTLVYVPASVMAPAIGSTL